MKIVHITDLHIGYNNKKYNCEKRAKTLVDKLIKKCIPPSDYTIVLTGDIVDKGKEIGEFEKAKIILDKLEIAGIKLLLVPGNHDYGSGKSISEKYQKRFKKVFYGNSKYEFPSCKIINNTAFIGLDSLQGEFDTKKPKRPNGSIGKGQLKKLREELSKPKVLQCKYCVVYLHHHPFYKAPFWIMALKDSKELGNILKEFDIDMLMFGHKHKGDILNGKKWGIPRIFDGGCSTGKKMDKPTPVRIIDLTKSSEQYQEWTLL